MLDKIADNKWLGAAAAAGITIFALSLWGSGSSIIWKLLMSLAAIFLINDAYQLFKKDRK